MDQHRLYYDNDNDNDTTTAVTVLVPQHVSVSVSVSAHYRPQEENVCQISCHQAGVLWRGMAPILLEAPIHLAQQLLQLVFESSGKTTLHDRSSSSSSSVPPPFKNNKNNDDDDDKEEDPDPFPGFHHRTIPVRSVRDNNTTNNNITLAVVPKKATRTNPPTSMLLYLRPPMISHLDATFSSIVVQTEHDLLRKQTLTAWWATLGGGYFFCRRLHMSLYLARKQRALALQVGNWSMARQCTVNEAYNLIYAGHFAQAKRILLELEATTMKDDNDQVTLKQCQAARVLAQKMKKVAKRLTRYEEETNHTVDDYQRIRIGVQ
jgi:hypothetical protein